MLKKIFYFLCVIILAFNSCIMNSYASANGLWISSVEPDKWYFTHAFIKGEHGWATLHPKEPFVILSTVLHDHIRLSVLTKFSNGWPIQLHSSCINLTINENGHHSLKFKMEKDCLIHCELKKL